MDEEGDPIVKLNYGYSMYNIYDPETLDDYYYCYYY